MKDTTDFVRKIQDVELVEGSILVSADVSGLYTVINHEEGAEACRGSIRTEARRGKKKTSVKSNK